MRTTKEDVYSFCETYVDDRLEIIHSQIQKLNEDLLSESKSTAGDKHETGRAMIQLEREKLGNQLKEADTMKQVLSRVSLEQKSKRIALGSLVVTNVISYYISISAGLFRDKDQTIYCISTSSPIGTLLLGKTIGDSISFRGKEQHIIQVY